MNRLLEEVSIEAALAEAKKLPTEEERINALLTWSQALPCGSVRNRDCKNPRARGDYQCAQQRAEFDAEFSRFDPKPSGEFWP